MAALKRLTAAYMLLLGAAVAVHFLATPFYDPELEGSALTVWRILDPLMVVGVVAALAAAFARKGRRDAEGANQSVDREYLEANVTFYFSAALLLALLWNWFGVEWVDPRGDDGQLWILIDVTLPILMVASAVRLLRGSSSQDG